MSFVQSKYFLFYFLVPSGKELMDNHLLQVDVMNEVAAVRVVKDNRHCEPGMQGNQSDELTAKDGYSILDFTSIRDGCSHTFGSVVPYRGAREVVDQRPK